MVNRNISSSLIVRIFFAFSALVSISSFFVAAIFFKSQLNIWLHWESTVGVVVAVEETYSQKRMRWKGCSITEWPIVVFTTVEGKVVTHKPLGTFCTINYSVGQQVSVSYLKKDPSNVQIQGGIVDYILITLFIFIGAMSTFNCVYMYKKKSWHII